ncbi:hypothetical protein PCANC_21157 [Puccinia coronata f. sp. avenae]|uniref:Alpha-type protein kinase domain-containing protein n=1 Tax=Puccinia coronata f. sp. avenae TaxID=200324 RepID=A0A2N5SSX8_9BASI|nr:hypothetical protein PCANC_21157 [Puccinia coronata f. sp. avenae]
MVTCLKCTKFVTQTQFGGWCYDCLVFVGLKPEHMVPNDSNPIQNSNIYNVIPPPSHRHAAPQLAPTPTPSSIPVAEDAGSKVAFRSFGKARRTKNPASSPYSKKSSSGSKVLSNASPIRFIKCGISFYQNDKQKKTGIISRVQQVNIEKPNVYNSLKLQLWQLFSPDLLRKNLVDSLPDNPPEHISLSHNKSLIDSATLLLLLEESTLKKPLQVDLMYEEKPEDLDTNLDTTLSTSRQSTTNSIVTRSRTSASNQSIQFESVCSTPIQSYHNSSANNSWELGGVAVAATVPITIKIDTNRIIGQGSMRIAYFAQVKTDSKNGGPPRITNWVAKQQYRDSFAQIKPHATDARMYEACGHLLQEYQHVIDQCTSNLLTTELKQKASAFELVRHCVIFTGDQGSPTDVYFLESALNGHYVKYCSNVNFAVTSDQDGMDVQNLWIMDAFSHWSFADSNGERLICDLQGVGSTLTDPQIIDVDKK